MDLTAQHQQQSFRFPLLKTHEIVQVMSELEIEITEDVLAEPVRHRDVIRAAFIQLIVVALGVSEHELFQPSKESLDRRATLEYPELHEDSLSEIRFLRNCIKLMSICGVSDFSMRDLINPTARRLRRQLSAYVNFVRYREDKITNVLEELVQYRNEDVIEPYEQTYEEHLLLKEQLQTVRRECEEDWRAVEAVENECAELERELSRRNKEQTAIRTKNNQLKKEINDIINIIEGKKLDLEKLQSEQENLRAQIVDDPEKILKEMEETKESLEVQKGAASNMQDEVRKSRKRIEDLKEVEKSVMENIETMKNVQNVIFQLREVEAKVEEKQRELVVAGKEADATKESLVQLEIQIENIKKEREKNRLDHESSMALAEEDYLKAKKDLAAAERGRSKDIARINDAEARVVAMETRISREREQNRTDLQEMMQYYRSLESKLIELDDALLATMGCSPQKGK